MITKVYAVFDAKAATFGQPYFSHNDAMAMRAFEDLVNDGRSMVSRHPGDFTLYRIGTYDDALGILESGGAGEALATAAAMQKGVKPGVERVIAERNSVAEVVK